MTHKSHTKLAFNHIASNKTVSHFLTNIKYISTYSLLTTLFTFFTMTASVTPAQAELVDLSNPEPVIQFASREASWLKPPTFDRAIRHNPIGRYLIHCSYDENGAAIKPCDRTDLKIVLSLRVDKQGSIKNIKVIESSGVESIDKMTIRELYKARLKPFLIKGQAVMGNVNVPIVFTAP
ncbi:energy transducer TonB [Psychrobacter sp. K31L]|uniref:energy transducer TonB n=1 Tax=Psychrobacter sp. K31L TaxID=2820758 RepID=UPI001B330209|nr:energy transducer TonB [Psychrobacter sp. K31L]MBP3946515.1 TonB family protein [Psychrobacter sp. K31L]